MLDTLPNDIIKEIIDELFNYYHPIKIVQYRNINHLFREIIDDKRIDRPRIMEDKIIKKEIDVYLRKNTNINQIEWLFNNHVNFDLDHVRTIIIYNRIDIIKKGFYYEKFLKLLFNRFYLSEDDRSDMYAAFECKNPLIIASKYNRIDIVKLLIESCSVGNPYTKVLNGILNIAATYSHKNLFCYLVTYHYDSIKQLMNSKINKLIYRFDNCEDIFFYLIINKKIDINLKLLIGCISKRYHDLFRYIYPKLEIKDRLELLNKTIHMNDIELFNYILNDYRITNEFFSEIIVVDGFGYGTDFIYNILNNHMYRITKESKIIKLCLENNIENDSIVKLIHKGYYYDDDEIQYVLTNKNIFLLTEMCNNYKSE